MLTVAVGLAVKDNSVFMGKRQAVDPDSPGLWEFPGGKVEEGESISQALQREFMEELDVEIEVGAHFLSLNWRYPERNVQLEFYFVTILNEASFKLNAHDEHRWISLEDFFTVEVLEANKLVLQELSKTLTR